MPNFKLTLAYDGTSYVGWQRQANGVSIQGLIEEALSAFDGRPVSVAGAGRTDAGVHALGQVASAFVNRSTDRATLVRAVNARLPPDVRVLEAIEVPSTFHARFSSSSKVYRYRVWNADVLSPFERSYAWHIPVPLLDAGAMSAAAAVLEGTHDFSAFQSAGTETHTSVRTVFSSRVSCGPEPALVTYEVCGDGFLRHMVRTIVGSLIDVGRGRYPPEWLADVLTSKSRARAGATAPAAGLFLVRVSYEADART